MSRLYRRDGASYPPGDIGLREWANDLKDMKAKIVKQDVLPNGIFVSTIWLGLDHSFIDDGPPLIFESMVFPKRGPEKSMLEVLQSKAHNWLERDMQRYSTEAEALAGHEALCKKWRKHK